MSKKNDTTNEPAGLGPDVVIHAVETRTLIVKLTTEEIAERAAQTAQLVGQIEQAEIAEAGRKKQVKEGIDGQRSHLRVLAGKVRTGEEYRDVRCDVVRDYPKVEQRVVRQDTGAVVESRALLAAEIQRTIPGTEK